MHLYLALLFHRDYFRRPDSSLSRAFAPQGLFPPSKCISVFLFCPTGMISAGRMHLYLALLFHRDYFRRPDASLPSSFVPQGFLRPAKCISILLFCSTGITLPRPDSSLSRSFAPQGLFPPTKCISILLFWADCSTFCCSFHVALHRLPLPLWYHECELSEKSTLDGLQRMLSESTTTKITSIIYLLHQ